MSRHDDGRPTSTRDSYQRERCYQRLLDQADRRMRPFGDGGPDFDLAKYARAVHARRGRG